MKSVIGMVVLLGASMTVSAETGQRINSAEAERACLKEIEAVYASETEMRFKPRPASSYKGGMYRFWINATEISDDGRQSGAYLCEISRAGEVVELSRKDGLWRA